MRLVALTFALLWSTPAFAADPYANLHPYSGEIHQHSGTINSLATQYAERSTDAITAFADGGGPPYKVVVTSNGHPLANNEGVTISATTNYDGSYEITNVGVNDFEITHSWDGNDATGTWVHNGDPRDYPTGHEAACVAHSFGHPLRVYTDAFDNGLDWVNISHHTNVISLSSANVTALLAVASGDYSELGNGDTWHFCTAPKLGLEMEAFTCTHEAGDGVTELDWMYEQAELAMVARPGKLAMVGGEWTVSQGHKVFASSVDDPLPTICSHQSGTYFCDNEVGLYKVLREYNVGAMLAHPCSDGSGITSFLSMDYPVGDGIDPRVLYSYGIKATGTYTPSPSNCLKPVQVTTKNNDKNAAYFNALDMGYNLYPSSDSDSHHVPASATSTCTGNSSTPGDNERTVVWARDLTFADIQDAMRARRAYWSRVGTAVARVWAYDELAGADTASPDAIMGGFVQSANTDFAMEATVSSDGATFTDMEVWYNGSKVLDDTDADITCTASLCTLSAHEFGTSIDGWWLLVVISATNYEVVTAPIWVNRTRADFLGAPAIQTDIVP